MDPHLLYWKSQGQSFLSRVRIWSDVLEPSSLFSSQVSSSLFSSQVRSSLFSSQVRSSLFSSQVSSSLFSSQVRSLFSSQVRSLFSSQVRSLFSSQVRSLFSSQVRSSLFSSQVRSSLFSSQVSSSLFSSQVSSSLFSSQVRSSLFSSQGSSSLFSSQAEIQKARTLFKSGEKLSEKDGHVWALSLSSVHADSGAVLPLVFRPPAFLPMAFPLFLLQIYSAGFNHANRNSSSEQRRPLLASLNVFLVRREESETGIQVFDSNGNPVGISKAAAEKAVRDTALSRAVLFGTTAAVPNLLLLLLQRIKTLQKNPLLVTSMHVMNVAFVLGLMLPVSFSLFPQLGTIQKEKLEAELQAAAVDDQLFYHRGL
ncbi:sideroflexin-4 [Diretmus argenteus]